MYLTKPKYAVLGGTLLVAMALATAGIARSNHRPDPVTVPELTSIRVTLDQALTSNQSRPGDRFDATVAEPISVSDKVVIPQGAHVRGVVVDARESGRLRGRARLQLALQSIEVDGKQYEIRTASSHRIGGNHKKRNFAWIGGGAGGGLLIGALAAGGKGALIGGPIGAGAGTAVAFFTGKKDIRLPAETQLTFKLAEPVTVELKS
ncbi:MAG TPA: hypothetical protein VNW47_11015 [Terriglobales bacterium]|jgi:hypothetical protein|nr:hypothetical protein [Terriglobales bacterium]